MKRLIITVLLSFFLGIIALAQDCDMCGTWIGQYRFPNAEGGMNIQVTLKISKKDENYRVRMKTNNLTEGGEYKFGVCHVDFSDSNTISWRISDPVDYDADADEYYTTHQSFIAYYSETEDAIYLTQTTLYFEFFDKNQKYKKKETGTIPYYMKNIPLLKQEDDW